MCIRPRRRCPAGKVSWTSAFLQVMNTASAWNTGGRLTVNNFAICILPSRVLGLGIPRRRGLLQTQGRVQVQLPLSPSPGERDNVASSLKALCSTTQAVWYSPLVAILGVADAGDTLPCEVSRSTPET